MNDAPVLLADIGGTHARFALTDPRAAAPLRDGSIREFAVADFDDPEQAIGHYLAALQARPERAVLAVAARIAGDQACMTNCPWVLSAPRLRAALRLDDVRLLNDFGAQAMAVTLLGDDDVSAIGSPGWSPAGRDADPQADRTYAVLGPGTGLGVGALLRRRGHWHALQTEGGHAGFAPVGAGEIAVLQVLSAQFGRVSNERLVSGMGLANLHRALSVLAGEPPSALRPEQVTAAAEAGDPRSRRVLDIFCAVFGGCAGDLVLTLGAWDGVFLAGGLVPRLLPVLRQSAFRERFVAKGRYSAAMAAVPALAVLHPQPGLLGAAALARQAAAPAG